MNTDLPGPGIHVLAAQAIRGFSLFVPALPQLAAHAPRDIVVALGVLWEDQVIYIWHSAPGQRTSTSQALAGFRMLPAWLSVIGLSLLAAESNDVLRPRFTEEQRCSSFHCCWLVSARKSLWSGTVRVAK